MRKSSFLEEKDLDEFFLQIVVEACKYIAQANHKSEELIGKIEQAAENVRINNFELTLLQKKLSKTSSDKIYKANVYRCINNLGERWYVEIEHRKNRTIVRYEMMKKYDHISKVEFFRQSYWEEDIFIIADKFGREMRRFEMQV